MIKAVFAVDHNCGIGYQNGLPWPSIKEDFKWFKTVTSGHVVVMGKTTWSSYDMPKPLPNRVNVVFSSSPVDGVETVSGDAIENVLRLQEKYSSQDIIVIGGANLISQVSPVLEQVHVTRVPGVFTCDTFIDLSTVVKHLKLETVTDFKTCVVEHYVKETK